MSIPSIKVIPIAYSRLDLPDFHFGLWNYLITGMDEFEVEKVVVDFQNNEIKVQAFFPIIIGAGLVQIKGNLFNMNLDSMGPIHANVSNIIINYTLKISLVEKDGKQYMVKDSDEIKTKQTDGKLYIHIDNLSFGNETATQIMNDVLNTHNEQFLNILFPILQKSLKQLLDTVLNTLFKTYSFDDFFPK
ncbi:PREDICTED: uncharacterized protein LOC108565826 [Nicrophorus vespilloides]|uniref:Uncharacterized protein LOC108565826 n=1 Tax=Nicrophorus vespilloides TaxID=110193 RepID=A0ABM1N2B0_NICVS|nr:PREDICTED: uncharacterized protein LOC108565826 [Nicrophorus vespilloides]